MTIRGGAWRLLSEYDRIMLRVEKRPDGHWMWTGARMGGNNEYGQVTYQRERVGVHRAVWRMLRGPIPAGLDILHHCGETLCCNPDHVSPGTHAENIREAVTEHGPWQAKGMQHPRAKLTDAQVRAIRARVAAGEIQRALAAEYGVSGTAISYIIRGQRWRSI